MGVVFVFGCVWLCLVVIVCVVFVVLLVASVLCGGDDFYKTKTKSVIKKNLAMDFLPLRF